MAPKSKFPQIKLHLTTYEELERLREKRESFDDVVRRLIVTYTAIERVFEKDKPHNVGEEPVK